MSQIFQLVYVSQAADSVCYSDITKILESSARHNDDNHITGILIYRDDHFLQILEGDEHKVMETMSRIIQDRRNHHVKVICESRTNTRIFDRWNIAFHDGDVDRKTAGLMDDLFGTALEKDKKEKEVVLQILKCFRRSNCQFQES